MAPYRLQCQPYFILPRIGEYVQVRPFEDQGEGQEMISSPTSIKAVEDPLTEEDLEGRKSAIKDILAILALPVTQEKCRTGGANVRWDC